MDTLTVVLIMLALAVVLLLGAVLADRGLHRRMVQRRSPEESPSGAPRKPDAADAVIDMLNRSGEMVRRAMQAKDETE